MPDLKSLSPFLSLILKLISNMKKGPKSKAQSENIILPEISDLKYLLFLSHSMWGFAFQWNAVLLNLITIINQHYGPVSQNPLQRQRRQNQIERSYYQVLLLPLRQQQTHPPHPHQGCPAHQERFVPSLGHWHLRILVRPGLQTLWLPLLHRHRQRQLP